VNYAGAELITRGGKLLYMKQERVNKRVVVITRPLVYNKPRLLVYYCDRIIFINYIEGDVLRVGELNLLLGDGYSDLVTGFNPLIRPRWCAVDQYIFIFYKFLYEAPGKLRFKG